MRMLRVRFASRLPSRFALIRKRKGSTFTSFCGKNRGVPVVKAFTVGKVRTGIIAELVKLCVNTYVCNNANLKRWIDFVHVYISMYANVCTYVRSTYIQKYLCSTYLIASLQFILSSRLLSCINRYKVSFSFLPFSSCMPTIFSAIVPPFSKYYIHTHTCEGVSKDRSIVACTVPIPRDWYQRRCVRT